VPPLALPDAAAAGRARSRHAANYVNGDPEPQRMEDGTLVPILDGVIRFAPGRIFDLASYHSGGAGMAGTASDILTILDTIRKGGTPLLSADTVKTMMADQAGGHMQALQAGVGFGYGWSVITDPVEAQVPFSAGTIKWGGVYGHSWFVDAEKGLTVVALTNTALEGMWGQFTTDLAKAVYAAL